MLGTSSRCVGWGHGDTVGRSANSVDLGDVWLALTVERGGLILGWRCLGNFVDVIQFCLSSVGRM
jgi:hypothetical protein